MEPGWARVSGANGENRPIPPKRRILADPNRSRQEQNCQGNEESYERNLGFNAGQYRFELSALLVRGRKVRVEVCVPKQGRVRSLGVCSNHC